MAVAALGGTARAVSLQPVAEFAQPIFITSDPADGNRLFVVEREGKVEEYANGQKNLYADISALVECCNSERGLLSIALPPDFDSTGLFYAAYTGTPAAGGDDGDLHVDAFTVPPGEPGAITRRPIITWPHSTNENHNGGQLEFGPDGHLYISAGDGGSGGDPEENAQNKEVLLGKILRIDPHPGAEPAYTVPAGNPFVGDPDARPEVWAYGLRNPWRFSFDSLTGDMVIGDVGQNQHEEVDFARSEAGGVGGGGRNYGWNCREGFFAYGSPGDSCLGAGGFTEPILDYPHAKPEGGGFSGCSITGGYVVRDHSLGALYGRYIYSDFCSGGIRSLVPPADGLGAAQGDREEDIPTPSGKPVGSPVSFGEDACHRLYVASSDDMVYRLVGDFEPSCGRVVVMPPPPKEVTPGDGPSPGQYEDALPEPAAIRVKVRLTASRAGADGRFRIQAEAVGCRPQLNDRISLIRGGRPHGSRLVGDDCSATFRVRARHPSTFRAHYETSDGRTRGGSSRLSLG